MQLSKVAAKVISSFLTTNVKWYCNNICKVQQSFHTPFFPITARRIEVKQIGHIHLRNCEQIHVYLKWGQSELSKKKKKIFYNFIGRTKNIFFT